MVVKRHSLNQEILKTTEENTFITWKHISS